MGNAAVDGYDNLDRKVLEDTHGLVNWFKLDETGTTTTVCDSLDNVSQTVQVPTGGADLVVSRPKVRPPAHTTRFAATS